MKKFLTIFLVILALLILAGPIVMAAGPDEQVDPETQRILDGVRGGPGSGNNSELDSHGCNKKTQCWCAKKKECRPKGKCSGKDCKGSKPPPAGNVSSEQLEELLKRLENLEKAQEEEALTAAEKAARGLVIWYFVLTCIAFVLSLVTSILTLIRLPRAPEATVLGRRIKSLEDANKSHQ